MPSNSCPECHKPIPANAPAGLCPSCLLGPSLGPAAVVSPALAVTTPQGGRVVAPDASAIARYFPQLEVIELIGQGGMGAVYKARQTKLDRLVAVKLIRPESSADPSFAERFMREARTLATLSHPGIVAVHDFGEIDASELMPASSGSGDARTLFYFIMEFVDGANLRQLMQTGRLSPELAVSIIPQVCDALQFAHDEGVIHRDIKPENILLDSKGRVRIADFGLAKLAGRTADEWTLTGTHQVMGTPQYMAPEQMSGSRHVDHRADIYSLGIVFYEMLTGTVPAGHFSLPSQKAPVDVRLDDVVLRAMASEPERRFQSARDLRSSVETISSPSLKSAKGNAAAEAHRRDAGVSTIIDREVAGVWRMLAGDSSSKREQRYHIPVMMMVAVCLLGCVSIFLPWFRIRETQTAAADRSSAPLLVAKAVDDRGQGELRNAVASESHYTVCQMPDSAGAELRGSVTVRTDFVREIAGKDLQTGWMAAVLFSVALIMWLLVPEQFRDSGWTTGSSLLLSLFALLMSVVSPIELLNPRLHGSRSVSAIENAVAGPARNAGRSTEMLLVDSGDPTLCVLQESAEAAVEYQSDEFDWSRIESRPGYVLPIASAGFLCLFSAAAFRRAVFRRPAESPSVADRSDSVIIHHRNLPSGMPDLCIVCGKAASTRVIRQIQIQPKWAEALSLAGFILGGIPGVIVHILTTKEIDVSCPVCHEHRGHFNKTPIYAAVGWLLIIVVGGLGFLTGYLPTSWAPSQPSNLALVGLCVGAVAGLLLYIVPLILVAHQTVKCAQSDDDKIAFSRVSSIFASAVRSLNRPSNG